jgi:phenylacetate-CoA ligase
VGIGLAALLRGKSWAGVRLGDKGVVLKGIGRVTLAGRLRERLVNTRNIEAYDSAINPFSNRLDQIKHFQPRYITGYATALMQLAETTGSSVLSLPIIISTGEMLYPAQRQQLTETFEASVLDYYGSNEITSLAYECELGTKHVVDEHVILETVDENGHPVWDKPGRFIITDLDNHAMPLIRYEIGDMGVLTRAHCRCGRKLRVLKSLHGRSQDVLRSLDGKILPAIFFASRFRDLRSVLKYQLVQTGWEEIELRYVAGGQSASEEINTICEEIRQRLGRQFQVRVQKKAWIPSTGRGKSRLVINNMDGQ